MIRSDMILADQSSTGRNWAGLVQIEATTEASTPDSSIERSRAPTVPSSQARTAPSGASPTSFSMARGASWSGKAWVWKSMTIARP
jgi:hypothetical protein